MANTRPWILSLAPQKQKEKRCSMIEAWIEIRAEEKSSFIAYSIGCCSIWIDTYEPGMVVCICNPSAWEVEPECQGQPQLYCWVELASTTQNPVSTKKVFYVYIVIFLDIVYSESIKYNLSIFTYFIYQRLSVAKLSNLCKFTCSLWGGLGKYLWMLMTQLIKIHYFHLRNCCWYQWILSMERDEV